MAMKQLSGRDMLKYIGIFVLCLGLIFFGVGFYMAKSNNAFFKLAKPAKLTVIGIDKKLSSSGTSNSGSSTITSLYRSVFSTKDINGETVTYKSNYWSSDRPNQIGDVVSGFYNEDSGKMMSDALIKSAKWLENLFKIIGSGTALVGLILLLWVRQLKTAK